MAIVPMKSKNGGDIVYRPEEHLELFPDLVEELPSQRTGAKQAAKNTQKEAK